MTALPPHLKRLRHELHAASQREVQRRARHRQVRLRAVLTTSATVAVGGTALAVPAVRSAASSLVSSFVDGGDVPGTTPSQSQAGDLTRFEAIANLRPGTTRIIAQNRGNLIVAYRNQSGDACFEYGPGRIGECGTPLVALEQSPVYLHGTATNTAGELAMYGLTHDGVKSVRLSTPDEQVGSAQVTAAGGFVLLAPASKAAPPLMLELLDTERAVIGRTELPKWPDDPIPIAP